MARVSLGSLDLMLDGDEYTMVVCIEAIDKIEARWGNIIAAVEACQQAPSEVLTYIVRHAAGLGQREAENLRHKIVKEGVLKVTVPVIKYLHMCLNPTGTDPGEDVEPGE